LATSFQYHATYHRYGVQLLYTGPLADAIANFAFRRETMLWTITVILLILWLLGVVGVYTVGAWIHLLLVLAIISIIFNLLAGRRAA
jgi:hypothetical protein